MQTIDSTKIDAIAQCIRENDSLAAAWEIIKRDERFDSDQIERGIKLAIQRGWTTQAEYKAI